MKFIAYFFAAIAIAAAMPAHAADGAMCRQLAPSMGRANDQIANITAAMENLQSFRQKVVSTLGGDEGKAIEEYLNASEEATQALRKFLRTARSTTLVIQNCADN